jgi:hypothetical protein
MSPPQLPSLGTATAAPAEAFITTTARLSLVMAVLGVLFCTVQLLIAALIGMSGLEDWLANNLLPPPPALQWLFDHGLALSAGLLLASIAFLIVSWGLLRRRQWAHWGFIVFLIVVAVANFACLPLIEALFSGFTTMFPAEIFDTEEGRELLSQLQVSRWTSLITGAVASIAMAALHAWLIIKLRHPDVRTLFR